MGGALMFTPPNFTMPSYLFRTGDNNCALSVLRFFTSPGFLGALFVICFAIALSLFVAHEIELDNDDYKKELDSLCARSLYVTTVPYSCNLTVFQGLLTEYTLENAEWMSCVGTRDLVRNITIDFHGVDTRATSRYAIGFLVASILLAILYYFLPVWKAILQIESEFWRAAVAWLAKFFAKLFVCYAFACALITMFTSSAAYKQAEDAYDRGVLNGQPLEHSWAKYAQAGIFFFTLPLPVFIDWIESLGKKALSVARKVEGGPLEGTKELFTPEEEEDY